MPTAAILLSRQPKHPHGGLPWVRNTVAAVVSAGTRGYTVLTSTGMNTWELVLAAAHANGFPVELLIATIDGEDRTGMSADIMEQFELSASLTKFTFLDSRTGISTPQGERDQTIVAVADLLLPVSIRPGGRMESLLIESERKGKAVDRTYQVPYESRHDRLAYAVSTTALRHSAVEAGADFLIHWTRTASSRWPDELAIDFYRAVIESEVYPRSVFHTLTHILTTRHLSASRRHMPRNIATVSFTGLTVAESLPLMRWRAKYAEMSFEPYGIGIRRDAARQIGIYPLQYYDPTVAFTACHVEPWLTQSIGAKTDWRQEREFRHKGDLNLKSVSNDKLIAFCPTQKEAAMLEGMAGIPTIALFG